MTFATLFEDLSPALTLTVQLHRYAKNADTQQISYLLSRGLHVDVTDACKRTALMLAINADANVSTLKVLLNENADIYTIDDEGINALGMIIEKSHTWFQTLTPETEHLTILSIFFERVGRDFFIDSESTAQRLQDAGCPLALVPFARSTAITKYFLERRWHFVACVGDDLTILHVAVLRQDLETVKTLVACGVYLDETDGDMRTALFAHNVNSTDTDDKIEILRLLLVNGASLHVPRRDGLTPMEYLLKQGNRRTRLTVLKSISVENCKSSGTTALHCLLDNRKIDHLTLKEEISILVSRGFNVNIMRDNKGISVLTFAIAEHHRIVEFLFENGAQVNWPEFVANTPTLSFFATDYYLYDGKQLREYYQKLLTMILQYQLDLNLKHLFKELNRGSSKRINPLFYAQIIIAHLAIAEAKGERLHIFTVQYIESNFELRQHFDYFKERIEQLKTTEVCDSVTLYQLLTASDEDIDRYICYQNFVSELQNLISQKCYQNLYYIIIIRKRVENAVKMKELRKRSGRVVCQLTGLHKYGVGEDHYVVYKIVNYLGKRDIMKLFEDHSVSHGKPTFAPNITSILRNSVTKSIRRILL